MLVNEFPFMETVRVAFFVDKIFFIYDDTANFMPNQEKILKVQWLHTSNVWLHVWYFFIDLAYENIPAFSVYGDQPPWDWKKKMFSHRKLRN